MKLKQNQFLAIVFLLIFFKSQSQDNATNLRKYWHYRYRLVNYFMVVGPEPGESLPADIRNWYGSPQGISSTTSVPNISWGDEPVYLGYYLGVLATEYALLHRNGENTDRTLTELYYALNAKLLQKIEELTLYLIDLQKQVDELKGGRK
jgi:hypothetical protein